MITEKLLVQDNDQFGHKALLETPKMFGGELSWWSGDLGGLQAEILRLKAEISALADESRELMTKLQAIEAARGVLGGCLGWSNASDKGGRCLVGSKRERVIGAVWGEASFWLLTC